MATNNYFGFPHSGTQYAAAANPAYQSTAAAYGVATAPGVSAAQTFSTQRAGTVYDSGAAYQATATPVTYTVAPGTSAASSYDYSAYAGRAANTPVGVTYDSTKTYYQQAAAQATQSASGVNAHVVGTNAAASSVSVASSDLQGWPAQGYTTNRQQTGASVGAATAAGKAVYHGNYTAVPTTRQLSVPPITQKIQTSTPSTYITQQQYLAQQTNVQQYAAAQQAAQQQSVAASYPYNVQSQTQTQAQSKAASVGTIGQPKKVYQQQAVVSTTPQSVVNMSGNYTTGIPPSTISSGTIGASTLGYNAGSSYTTAYPLNTVHNIAQVAKQKPGNTIMATAQLSNTYTAYDTAVVNAALYMNQGTNQQRNNKPVFKPRPGLGSTVRPYKPKMPPKPQQLHYCDICKISCAGPGAYHDHLQGQKHKKKVAKPKVDASKPTAVPGLPIFTCELCDVECTAADAYAAHLRGSKHTKVVKLHTKLGKPIPALDPKAAAAIAALNAQEESTHASSKDTLEKTTPNLVIKTEDDDTIAADLEAFIDDRPAVGMEYIDEEKDDTGKLLNYNCKLCDCKFSDPNAKEMHMKGRKHRLAFKKKVDPELKVEVKVPFGKFRKDRFTRKKAPRKFSKFRDGKSDKEDDGEEEGGPDVSSGPGGRSRGIRRTPRGSRMLAEEGEHRLWEQEYRRYEEDLREYREWNRKYGGTGAPMPHLAMPGMLPRDHYMRGPRPLLNPSSLLGPGLPHHMGAPFLMGFGNVAQSGYRIDSIEDKHINARHRAICPNDIELKIIYKVVTAIEKSVKSVSDQLMDTKDQEQNESPIVKGTSSQPKRTNAPEIKNENKEDGVATAGGNRILTGINRVGMLAKTLLLHGDTVAEMVLLCSVKPTLTLLNKVVSLLPEHLKAASKDDMVFTVIPNPSNAGFIIAATGKEEKQQEIRIVITMTSPIVREEIFALQEKDKPAEDGGNVTSMEITSDPPDVLSKAKCLEALAAVRHAKWFQARVVGFSNYLLIIRILKDLCRRVPTWAPFDSWPMELLVERTIKSSNGQLSPGDALRRVFEAISSGLLLPDGPGLQDPCEKDPVDSAKHLTAQQREDITASAQHALRMIAFGQIHQVLGMEKLPPPPARFRTNNRKRRRENSAGKSEVDGKKDKKEETGVEEMEVESTKA